ncbi:ABC transporter ATP-binding protein [Chloroflexota bacterium]
MLLELKNVTVHYEKAEALKEVSVGVDEGEVVTIIGSNGAGKTTILKAIAALVRPTRGEIWFESHRIDGLPPEKIARRGVGFCMEGRRLFPFMTVLENLQMGAYCRRDKDGIRRDLENVFNLFPVLHERHRQKAGTLSGGEQQMLTIGRALMSKPKLLLIDEPSLGLAPLVVAGLARTVKELNRAELTVLLVEQNAQMALSLAHRGYILEVGKVTTEGDSQSLRSNDHVSRAYLGV